MLVPRARVAAISCTRKASNFLHAGSCLSIKLSPSSTRANTHSLGFSSFFFHNGQWKAPVKLPTSSRSSHVGQVTPASTSELEHAVSSTPRGFREAEVLTPGRILRIYSQLSKTRLTTLVVLTAMAGVAVSPLPATVPVLLSTAFGTALCAASANTFNQIQEVPLDAQMARTRMRPLVRRAISPLHATAFGISTGVVGPVILWTMVNPTTALLGAANIFLYAGPYTWLKRTSIVNTWVGAVVGALPPLMGWTACGGQLLPSSSYPAEFFLPSFLSASSAVDISLIDNPLAPLALFMLLFSWQFPHFNSLSHLVRGSYAQAGYRMLSIIDPAKNAVVALRHSLLFLPICSILVPLSGLTSWAFAVTSLLPNGIILQAAWSFWKHGGEKQARVLWHHSLWWLPVILGLMMFHKSGMEWMTYVGLEEENTKEIKHP